MNRCRLAIKVRIGEVSSRVAWASTLVPRWGSLTLFRIPTWAQRSDRRMGDLIDFTAAA